MQINKKKSLQVLRNANKKNKTLLGGYNISLKEKNSEIKEKQIG